MKLFLESDVLNSNTIFFLSVLFILAKQDISDPCISSSSPKATSTLSSLKSISQSSVLNNNVCPNDVPLISSLALFLK